VSFVVKIEAPGSGQAETAIARVEGALAKTTTAADKTRDAMGRVVGTSTDLARLAAATDKVAVSTKQLAAEEGVGTGVSAKLKRAHDEMIGVLAREADIIERIRGPMREYRADMDALEGLYKRNKISAAEYDDELQRLIKTQGTMHGPVKDQAKAKEGGSGISLSGIGSALASGGLGGALVALPGVSVLVDAVAQIHHMVDAYHQLRDEYIQLTNTALKFVDAAHSVNAVIDEQLSASEKLHTKLDVTIDLYDAVRDGTDGLNVSHAEQLRLQQSLGEAFILAGKGVEQAGGLMQKFSYALASGKIETRELKGIMREVPEIADAWTAHFGMTRVELTKALAAGKIGTEDLMQAILAESAALDANYGKRKRTNAQLIEEEKKRQEIIDQRRHEAGQMGEGYSGGSVGRGGERADFAYAQRMLVEQSERTKQVTVALENKRKEMTKMIAVEYERNASIAGTAAAAIRAGISIGEFDQAAANAASRVKVLLESVGVSMPSAFSEAKNRAALLNIEVEKLGESKALEKLTDQTRKLYYEQNQGAKVAETIKAVKDRTNEHADALKNLKTAHEALDPVTHKRSLTDAEYQRELKALGVEESAAAKLLHEIQAPQKAFTAGTSALTLLLDQGKISAAEYNAELTKLTTTFAGAEMAKLFDFTTKEFKPHSQANEYKQYQADLEREKTDLEHESLIGSKMAAIDKQYSRPDDPDLEKDLAAFEKQQKLLESKTFAGAWKEMNADAKTFGQILAGEVNSGLDKLNDALITAANGGEVAWGKMAESILDDLERILLKQLEIAAITALLNYVAPGLGNAATASGATGEVVNQVPSQTSRIGPGAYPDAYPTVGAAAAGGVASSNVARSSGGGTLAPVVNIHNHYDKQISVAAISTREGSSAVLNVMRVNGGAGRR